MKTVLNAANVIASVAGTVLADSVTGGVGSAISGAMSLNEILRRLMGTTPQINARIAADLQAELERQHLTEAQRRLIPQMIERAALTPSEVMASARNPARITTAMLAKMTDPAHRTPAAQDAFSRVVKPVLAGLIADEEVANTLRPAFEQAVAESLAFIGEQVELLTQQLKDQSERMGVGEALLRTLARRYAPGSDGDLLQAHAGLEQALEAAQRLIAQGSMPSNLDAQVQATLAEVSRLVQDNRADEASALVDRELARLADEVTERNQARSQLHQTATDLARTYNDPASASQHILAKLKLEAPSNLFVALQEELRNWRRTGEKNGSLFDVKVALRISELLVSGARAPLLQGVALNELGSSLLAVSRFETDSRHVHGAILAYEDALSQWEPVLAPAASSVIRSNLGSALFEMAKREGDRLLLGTAVSSFRAALGGLAQEVAPKNWANTQNNLGMALAELGTPVQLVASVAAYEGVLEHFTRDSDSWQWASTQNNLGNALRSLGRLEANPVRLKTAIVAHENALLELTRERIPMEWAATQNNLGASQAELGKLLGDTIHLQAASRAYEAALLEWTRDRMPMRWAGAKANLANLDLAFHALSPDPARLVAAREKALAAREVFVAAKASAYVGMVDRILAQIDAT